MTLVRIGLVWLATLAVATAAATVPSPSEALARCAVIDAPDARLSCYDALAGRQAQRSAAVTAPSAAAPARPTAAATPAPAAARSSDPRDFGLTALQRKIEPSGPAAIEVRIVGLNADRLGNAVVTLDNGQVWSVHDNDARLEVGEQVTIKRAALGSFLMTTPERHAYHVRRTR